MLRAFFDFWKNNASVPADRFDTKLPGILALTAFFVLIAGGAILKVSPLSSKTFPEFLYIGLMLSLLGGIYLAANSLEPTSTRLICKAVGFIKYAPRERIVFEVRCTDIAGVRVHQNQLQKLLDVGTLALVLRPSSDYQHPLYIRNINKPEQVAKLICKRANASCEKWWI